MTIRKIRKLTRVGSRKCNTKGEVKWARLCEIDRRFHVGSPGWFAAHPEWRVKKLSAWRAMHKFRRHSTIRKLARSRGKKPSSAIRLRDMIALVRRWS